jgi:hypothetical protein
VDDIHLELERAVPRQVVIQAIVKQVKFQMAVAVLLLSEFALLRLKLRDDACVPSLA